MRTPRWLAGPMLWAGIALLLLAVTPLALLCTVLEAMRGPKWAMKVAEAALHMFEAVTWRIDEAIARLELNRLDVRWVKDNGSVDD